jgi:hypothetical protein
MKDIQLLLTSFNKSPGATDALIAETELRLKLKLPEDYLEFLRLMNGGEGFIGESSYAFLWGVDELATLNEAYSVRQYASGFLIFGSDGGGEAYGFDTRTTPWPVVQVPFVGMDWSAARLMGSTFDDFLQTLYNTD